MKRNFQKGLVVGIMILALTGVSNLLYAQNGVAQNQTIIQQGTTQGTYDSNNVDGSIDYSMVNNGYGCNDYCYGNNECGNYVSGGMVECGTGCCEFGLLPLVRDITNIAMSPIYMVAALLSSGTYSDCGCAPRVLKERCEPCDFCGNWMGCNYCGGQGCSYCSNTTQMSVPENSIPTSEMTAPILNNNVQPLPERTAPLKTEQVPVKPLTTPVPNNNPNTAKIQMNKGPVRVIANAPGSIQQTPVNRSMTMNQQRIMYNQYQNRSQQPIVRNESSRIQQVAHNYTVANNRNQNVHYQNVPVYNKHLQQVPQQNNVYQNNVYQNNEYQEVSLQQTNQRYSVMPQASYPTHYTASQQGLLYPGK